MPQPMLSGLRREKQPMSPVTKACDMCRQKKIRCDVISDVCAQCVKYNTLCHFTPIRMTRTSRRSGRGKPVQELEKRLKSLEGQLERLSSNQQPEVSDIRVGYDDGMSGAPVFPHLSDVGTSDSSFNLDVASTITGGQSSDFNLSSPAVSFNAMNSSQGERLPRSLDFDSNVQHGRAAKDFPSKDKLLNIVEKSFQGFYPVFPLFDKARLMSVFDSLDTSMNDPGRWACLNVVLALTSQFQDGTAQRIAEDYETWTYFQTAFALVGQLMTMQVTLWSVQALLGMALIMQGTPDQGPVSLLVSAAMNIAHRMGLHRRCQDPNISSTEIEERKRVFWIAYSLDKDLSLRMGHPSAQDDDDMDVELPNDIDNGSNYHSKSNKLNFFNFRVRLAMIQGQIYKRLHSVKANRQTLAERVKAATELEAILLSWRASVPIEIMQDLHGSFLDVPTSVTTPHPIILQLLYFHSLAIVYNSLPTFPRYRELQGTGDPMEFQLLSTPPIYAAEARKAMELLQITPRRRYACIWAVLYIFVKATTTLLRNIICDPSNPIGLLDLQLIEPFLTLLGVLANSTRGQKSERIAEMHRSCMELSERANIAIKSTGVAEMGWNHELMGGSTRDHEGTEDFLERTDNISLGSNVELNLGPPGISRDFIDAMQQQYQEELTSA